MSEYVFLKTFWNSHFENHHHHHHDMLVARISLTLSRHFYQSFIASGRSSGQHPVSSHRCWMYVRAGRPAFAQPCVGVHEFVSASPEFFSTCSVHIHSKLIWSRLCSAEQNKKTSLKNNNEWFIFMTESRLVSEWEKVLLGYQVAVSQVVHQFFSVLQVAVLVLLCV